MRIPKTSILVHGKPKLYGYITVPMELVPESWEVPEPSEAPAPAHSVSYKEYRDHSCKRVAFYNCNPCARDGGDQAQLQHLTKQKLYFLSNGKITTRWILSVTPQVIPDEEREYNSEGHWIIHYGARRA